MKRLNVFQNDLKKILELVSILMNYLNNTKNDRVNIL